MSAGKVAAQSSHAAVEAFRISDQTLIDAWYVGGHHTKLVMEARDTEHLLVIDRYIRERGFKTHLVIDEGRTEIEPHTPTALGVEIVDRDDEHVAATFGEFKTFRSPRPPKPEDKAVAPAKTKRRFGRKK